MRKLLMVAILVVGCGPRIEKAPNTVYVVVNNTNGGQNSTTGVNGNPNGAPNNEVTPNNVAPNNVSPNNVAPNNVAPNNVTPTNNANPNNVNPTNNAPTNNANPTNNAPGGDACNNASDIEALYSAAMPEISRDCAVQCLQDPMARQCTADCNEMNLGTSPDCSLCVADFSACGVQNCLAECIEDPRSEPCIICLEVCQEDFVACGGVMANPNP